MNDYKQGNTIYILMGAMSAHGLLEDWLQHNYECDLMIRRYKKKKRKMVVETTSLIWANRIVQWHSYDQVTYSSKNENEQSKTGDRIG